MQWTIVFTLICLSHGNLIYHDDFQSLIARTSVRQEPSNARDGRDFDYLTYEDIRGELVELEEQYPDLVSVYTAQEKYGLPSSGLCGEFPCMQWVVEISNGATAETPQVFFSGELHGDERVGPTTLMEFIRLVLESYTADDNLWIKRLVDTRKIILMPATNAQGYHERRRTENSADPNRDFAIDTTDCMNTITARAVNEVWRENLVQMALTFHGGIQAIAYEWGTVPEQPNGKRISPDDNAQLQLGSSMSAYAGAIESEGRYPHGRINDLVYPVRGGMEDWGYAGSFLGRTDPCQTTTFGGYSTDKTRYNSEVLRAFNILIETSRSKTPSSSLLGGTTEILRPEGSADGHIPRNVRLMLLVTDLVQPYVQWVDASDTMFRWEVGGAMHVDETYLEYAYQTASGELVESRTPAQSGRTRWSGGGRFDAAEKSLNEDLVSGLDIDLNTTDNLDDRSVWPFIPAFEAFLTLPEGANLVRVTALAMVDQTWADQPIFPTPRVKPQAHVVRARTQDDYVAENGAFKVVGQRFWSSDTYVTSFGAAVPTSEPVALTPSPTSIRGQPPQASSALLTSNRGMILTCLTVAHFILILN